jgi:hypothetical protein
MNWMNYLIHKIQKKYCLMIHKNLEIHKKNWKIRKKNWEIHKKNWGIRKRNWEIHKMKNCTMVNLM